MADSVRQKIVTAFEARMKTITVANGYKTAIGNNVFGWSAVKFQSDNLPCIVYRDLLNEPLKIHNSHIHDLTIDFEGKITQGATVPEDARDLVADIYEAIGYDVKWRASDSAVGSFTVADDGGDMNFTINGHGRSVDDVLQFSSDDTLPTGLSALTDYWIISKETNTFKVSTTPKGSSVAYSNAGTGTHTATLFSELARGTEVVSDEMVVEQEERMIAGVKFRIKIQFETVIFDPYTQTTLI